MKCRGKRLRRLKRKVGLQSKCLHGNEKERHFFKGTWTEAQSREELSSEESTTPAGGKEYNEYVDYSYEEDEDHTSSPYKR